MDDVERINVEVCCYQQGQLTISRESHYSRLICLALLHAVWCYNVLETSCPGRDTRVTRCLHMAQAHFDAGGQQWNELNEWLDNSKSIWAI